MVITDKQLDLIVVPFKAETSTDRHCISLAFEFGKHYFYACYIFYHNFLLLSPVNQWPLTCTYK